MEIESVRPVIKPIQPQPKMEIATPEPVVEPIVPQTPPVPQAPVVEHSTSDGQKKSTTAHTSNKVMTSGVSEGKKIDDKRDSLTELQKNWAEQKNVSEKSLREMIDKANKRMKESNREVDFSIHEKTNTMLIKLVNSQTKEVVKEYPPEEVLDVLAKLMENAGLLVDEKS